MKSKRDYAAEIEKAISEYESNKPYHRYSLSWISDRISWCWRFKHITKEQLDDFCDRMCILFVR